jgi:sulfatase maturation enzyme AslB (radical SAM superfamily)
VNRSNPKVLDFNSIRKGIDIFLNFPIKEQTITFTTTEPLMIPELYRKTIDYILQQTKTSKKVINIVTTTNGINLNEKTRDFIIKKIQIYDRLRLNISIDGKQKSHDAHRKLKSFTNKSSFELSWNNFCFLPKEDVRVIFTVTPSETPFFRENIDFILKSGFKKLDIFPQMFTLWSSIELKNLQEEMILLISRINNDLERNYDLRLLNRLWGSSDHNELLLGCNGYFYLSEWILLIPYSDRKRYIIGNPKEGIDLVKRLVFFNQLFEKVVKATRGKCSKCNYRNLCSFPLPLFLWCHYNNKDFNRYFKNFCKIAKIFINLSKGIKNEKRNELDTKKLY